MKQKDIEALSVQEIRERIQEEKANLNKMSINHAVSPIENPMKIRSTRRLIAALNTELSKKVKASK